MGTGSAISGLGMTVKMIIHFKSDDVDIESTAFKGAFFYTIIVTELLDMLAAVVDFAIFTSQAKAESDSFFEQLLQVDNPDSMWCLQPTPLDTSKTVCHEFVASSAHSCTVKVWLTCLTLSVATYALHRTR